MSNYLAVFNEFVRTHTTYAFCDHCQQPMSEPLLVNLDKRLPESGVGVIYQHCTRCHRSRFLDAESIALSLK
jgi:hypothetical protein